MTRVTLTRGPEVGDRVIISAPKDSRLSYANALQGTIITPGPHEFLDEKTVQLDGCDSYLYVPLACLVPGPKQTTCGPLCGDTTCVECVATPQSTLPVDSQARKDIPITTGALDYFPAALAYVARVSKAGNDKHNPGEPLHWARGKSMDQADTIGRHLLERGTVDPEDGLRHSGKLAWRALALLQLELEEAGEAPLARGASA